MALSRVLSGIVNVEKCRDLEIWVKWSLEVAVTASSRAPSMVNQSIT